MGAPSPPPSDHRAGRLGDLISNAPVKERGERNRLAQRRTVTTVDLLGSIPRRSRTTGRSHVAGKNRSLRHRTNRSGCGPCREWPWLSAGRVGLASFMRERLVCEVRRDVVVEDRPCARVIEPLRLPTGVGEHLLRRFARQGHHPRYENDRSRTEPLRDDRRDVTTERLGDHDDVAPVADRVDDDICIPRQPGAVVLDREIGCDGLMAATLQLGADQMPVPADVAGSVDECKRGHQCRPLSRRTFEKRPTGTSKDRLGTSRGGL